MHSISETEIRENINAVRARIDAACKRAGRSADEVTLVAVSKTKPVPMLRAAYDVGVRDFGENKVQELVGKMDALPEDIRWHMIGHLQTNKVKYIVGRVYMIHSVDSLHLAREISREAVKKGVTVRILLEVNIADEASKFGADDTGVVSMAKEILALPNLDVQGLMCVAPYTEDPESNRPYFRKLKELGIRVAKSAGHSLVDTNVKKADNNDGIFLSMGMSGDYEVAVEEGASFVRVGSSIFGEREYQK